MPGFARLYPPREMLSVSLNLELGDIAGEQLSWSN